MAKFMFIYRGGGDHFEEMSPEEMQKVMQSWMDWIQGGMEAGWLLDGGDALKAEGSVVQSDSTVTDGPFAESKELVGGYSIVQADNMKQACEYAKTTPITAGGGTVEVRELANAGQQEE